MPGMLHKKCDTAALGDDHRPHRDDVAELIIVDDGDGIDVDEMEEVLRSMPRRRVPVSTA